MERMKANIGIESHQGEVTQLGLGMREITIFYIFRKDQTRFGTITLFGC